MIPVGISPPPPPPDPSVVYLYYSPYIVKRIDFAPCYKSYMANKLLSTNLELFLRRIESPLTR